MVPDVEPEIERVPVVPDFDEDFEGICKRIESNARLENPYILRDKVVK